MQSAAKDPLHLTPAGPGEWTAEGVPRFDRGGGALFGGLPLGLLLSAVLLEPSRSGAPVSMTNAFMRPMTVGPATISTTLLRAGAAFQFWQASIAQSGKACVQSTITLAQRPEDGPRFSWIAMPEAPAPETIERTILPPELPPFLRSFDQRWVYGSTPFTTAGVSLEWSRDTEECAFSLPRLAMFADMFPPRSFYGGVNRPGSTVSSSIYFHASEAEVASVGLDFVLKQGAGRQGSRGICDLTAAIWRRDGLLLATTEQIWWFT